MCRPKTGNASAVFTLGGQAQNWKRPQFPLLGLTQNWKCSYYGDLRNQHANQLTKDRDRHPVRHMYSLLSSSDPAVQTQLATFFFKALEKRKQSKVYTSLN